MSARSCEDCKHDSWWIEYGVYCHECTHPKVRDQDWILRIESFKRDPAEFCNEFELERMPHQVPGIQNENEGLEFWEEVAGKALKYGDTLA